MVDFGVLFVAGLVVILTGWSYRVGTDLDQRVAAFFGQGLPGWLSAVCTIAYIVGGLYAITLIVSIWLFGEGRSAIARDMVLGAVFAGAIVVVAAWLAGSQWPDMIPELFNRDQAPSFPTARLAGTIAVARVASPYLAAPMRQLGRQMLIPMTISAVVLSYGTISSVFGAIAAGIGAAALVRLLFGTGEGIPSRARITSALATVGIEPTSMEYLPGSAAGIVMLNATLADDTEAQVKLYGRDAAGAETANRLWRSLWYRQNRDRLTVTGMQQVEHEALALLTGQRADAPVVDLIGWGRGGADDAFLVTRWPGGKHLSALEPPEITDDVVPACWRALAKLHAGGIAHTRLAPECLVVTPDGVRIDDLADAMVSPDAATVATDIAAMLVITTLATNPEVALEAARPHFDDDQLAAALEVLQRPALSVRLQHRVKAAKLKLDDLREATARSLDTEPPPLAQLARVTWGSVAMVVLTFFAASALISSLADIGLEAIVDQLGDAKVAWLVVALILAQLTNLGEYISLTGLVRRDVPFGPTIMFRYAISFISLAVPSDAGAIAMNVRYMQRLGLSAPEALAQGPLLTIISKAFDILLLLVSFQAVDSTVDFSNLSAGPVLRLLLLAGGLIVVGTIITLAVPVLRNKVVPPVQEGLRSIKGSLTDPRAMGRVAAGTMLQKVLFALTLSASVTAFSGSITFSEALFVNSAVSLFVGLVPVPGGIGVAEAAITAGLTAVGVPQGVALAAAISHRMVTAYLPPIYGWYTTRWLTAREYL